MVDQGLFLRTLSEFARTLVVRYEIVDVLYALAERTTALLDVAGAGVSLVDGDRLRFVTGVNEATVQVEQTQERIQEGVCVDAWKSGKVVTVPVLPPPDGSWAEFVENARAAGFAAVAGIPMRLDDEVLGAVNVYSAEPRPWSDDDIATAQVLADMATIYLVNASELEKSRRTTEQLQEALQTRIVIEQAKGILSAERKMSMDKAFETLRMPLRGPVNWKRGHSADRYRAVPAARHQSVGIVRDVAVMAPQRLGVTSDCAEDIGLAVSEACTNVIDHSGADDEYEVKLDVDGDRCEVRAIDAGRGFDVGELTSARPDPGSPRGRGVLLMRALVDSSDFRSEPEAGTIVHLVKALDLDPAGALSRLCRLDGSRPR